MNSDRAPLHASASQNQLDANGSRASSSAEAAVKYTPARLFGAALTTIAVAACLAIGTDCMFCTFQNDSGLRRNQSVVATGFSASTLLTLIITTHSVLYYPAYLLYMLLHVRHFNVMQTTRECLQVFKYEASGHRQLPLSSLIRSLEYLDAALTACIVFVTHCGLEYFQCWIILHRKFLVLRVVSFLLAAFCLITQTYIDFCKFLCYGVLMVASASVGISLYKVFLRKYISVHLNKGQVAFYFSLKGLVSGILLLPVVLSLIFTDKEAIILSDVDIGYLVIGMVSLMGYVLLIYLENVRNSRQSYTLGCILSIPLSLLLPSLRGALQPLVPLKTLGLITAVLSASITLIPEQWISASEKLLNTKNTSLAPKDRLNQTPSKSGLGQARH